MFNRIYTVEEKIAHLERSLNDLSEVVARQQKDLERAVDQNRRLTDKIAAMESDFGPSATAHEKPPHY
jgi:SlyX protein